MSELTLKDVEKAYQDADEDFDYMEGFEVVEGGKWEGDCKGEHKETVIKHTETERFFTVSEHRQGCYSFGYHYEEPDFQEVVTVKKYVTK